MGFSLILEKILLSIFSHIQIENYIKDKRRKRHDNRNLEELIGSKFPVSSFESDIKNFFFIRKHSKKLWFSNILCEIKVGDATHQVNYRCCIESAKEKNMFCLVLEHKDEMVYVKEGYLEKI